MIVEHFMTAPVTTCTVDANVGKVRDLMKLKGFSALPVVKLEGDEISIQGIVTYRDIAGVYDDNVNVKQVMTQRVRVVPPQTTATRAAKLMVEKGIHHLVVMEGTRIVGLLSSADFVKLVSKYGIGPQ